jgi:CTP:molybdopterin cytidylyltransferase MocA
MERKQSKVRCIVFAGGKSTRMGTGRSKMLEQVERDGGKKPMLAHTIDLLTALGLDVTVMVGYDGTAVSEMLSKRYPSEKVNSLRVSQDDGSGLEPNTGGSLKKHALEVVEGLEDDDDLLFCVGDQPFMQLETVRDFIERHTRSSSQASILLADVRDTPMERSTSTRVSLIGSGPMFFDTPPREGPFDGYSTLVDVGVVLIRKRAFAAAVEGIRATDVFSKLLCHLPRGSDRITCVRAVNPYQFVNVNENVGRVLDLPRALFPPRGEPTSERFVDRSEILLRWLEWNILEKRSGSFDIFAYPFTYRPEFEVDTTLLCHGTPGCRADCTYRQKHMKVFLDQDVGKYAVQRSKALGFSAVLFSGGGENLEDEAYCNFLTILTTARNAGLQTNLATNGVNLSPTRIQELIFNLDSIRFSIPPTLKAYCHLGVIAPHINLARKLIREQFLPTKLYANFLMTPRTPIIELEADILLLSQLGVDGIRFKGQHECTGESFVLRPRSYINHVAAIRAIQQRKDLSLPPITISKLERMITEPEGTRPFDACWYRDFNPLVIGCNSHNYACCEMKYEDSFDCGEIRPSEDNLRTLVRPAEKPQSINASKCFRGCKGYLVNIDLQRLLNEYETRGRSIFENPENIIIRDRALRDLVRSVLTN